MVYYTQDESLDQTIVTNSYFSDWVDCSQFAEGAISLVKMVMLKEVSDVRDPLVKTTTLTIYKDRTYEVFVLGRRATVEDLGLPQTLNSRNLKTLSDSLANMIICQGLNEDRFLQYLTRRKGSI